MPHPRVLVQKEFQIIWDDKVDRKKGTEEKVDSIKYSQSFKLDPFSAYTSNTYNDVIVWKGYKL